MDELEEFDFEVNANVNVYVYNTTSQNIETQKQWRCRTDRTTPIQRSVGTFMGGALVLTRVCFMRLVLQRSEQCVVLAAAVNHITESEKGHECASLL